MKAFIIGNKDSEISMNAIENCRKSVNLDIEFIQQTSPDTLEEDNFDGLVSTDFIRSEFAVTIDHRFLNVTDNYVKLICWYDNEWGYSSKVVDLISHIANG